MTLGVWHVEKNVVIILPLEGDVSWEALTESLKRESSITVLRAGSDTSLEAILSHTDSAVLIAPEGNTNLLKEFETCPELSVVTIDSKGADAIVRLRDIGYDMLLRLIRSLAAELRSKPRDKKPKIRKLTGKNVNVFAFKGRHENDRKGYHDTRSHLEDLRKWVSLRIHELLIDDALKVDGVSVPGWAMTGDRARALLDDEFINADKQTLLQARESLEQEISARESYTRIEGEASRFITLVDAFELNDQERQILLFVLVNELDGRYGRIFGYLNDDLTRRRPTASLVADLVLGPLDLAWDVYALLSGNSPLSTYELIQFDPHDTAPHSEIGLSLVPEILTFLQTVNFKPFAFGTCFTLHEARETLVTDTQVETRVLLEKLLAWKQNADVGLPTPTIQLVGDESTVQWFKRAASSLGNVLLEFDLASLADKGEGAFLENAKAAARIARMQDAILLVTGLDGLRADERERIVATLMRWLEARVQRLAIYGQGAWLFPTGDQVWRIERDPPGVTARTVLWSERARSFGHPLSKADAEELGAIFTFDLAQIDAALRLCSNVDAKANPFEALKRAARQVSRAFAPEMAQCLELVFNWDDIVLPDETLSLLKQIPDHIYHAGSVLEDWGFQDRLPYGRGLTALFSGPSGTGKTMAAQIIARDLGVELCRVDLAKTVSKYIGETEKNLERIFDAAEQASAVLLFDEADALFGKRTEVKDAHDRYANVEVAFLLQRMESYRGLAILTTNLKQNLDNSFLRRLRFVIDFPAPQASHRHKIWVRVFPEKAPRDDNVDFSFLARRLELTGGNIQQIAVRAAFAAASSNQSIGMEHIVRATQEELIKLGMLSSEKKLNEAFPLQACGSEI
jgi:hypothetical protein